MKKCLLILLFPLSAFAQDFTITDTIFLDKDWFETKNRSQALYYRGAWFNSEDSMWLVHDFYLENFSIQMTGTYSKSIKPLNQSGEFRYYYKNGNLRAIYHFEEGKMNGNSTTYYENGNLESKRYFESGVIKDTLYFYYETGIIKEIKFLNPTYDSENASEVEKEYKLIAYWSPDGEQQIEGGNGTRVEYYSSGKKRVSIEYSYGFPHGNWIQYGENKKIISKMTFKNGRFISGQMYPKRKKDIFATLYREPRFPGGVKAIDEFVLKNTGKCKERLQDEVLLMIRISDNGQVEFDQIISGNVSHCQYEELEELVKKMPRWMPAIRYGKYVESTYIIRVKS